MTDKKHKITLVNVNLMYAVIEGDIDFQAYKPLGLLSIASCIEDAGHEVDLRDYQIYVRDHGYDPFDLDSFCNFMDGCSNIIGFSCMSNLLPFALLAAKRLKEVNPNYTIILGGVGPTGSARGIMQNFDWVDYVCSGEGEDSIVELMNSLTLTNNGKYTCEGVIPGFYLRMGDEIKYVPRPRIRDLDALPLPAYHLVNFEDYDAASSVITSRGCPYRCTFCTETNHWNNKLIFRSIDDVINEIKFICAHTDNQVILFQDDQITANRKRAMRLFQRIIDEKLDIMWKCFVRVDLLDAEMLELMVKSGCIQVRFGIESGSNEILHRIKKGFTIEEAYEAIKLAHKYVASVHTSFIWGYPFETMEQFKESIHWIDKFMEEGCTVLNFLLSPLPNSEIFVDYDGPLDFNQNVMANFNCSGGENISPDGTQVTRNAKYMFDFIKQYPRLFPGFYLFDYENNIAPKKAYINGNRDLIYREQKEITINKYEDVDL